MPVTPDKARRKREAAQLASYSQHEARIDEYLCKNEPNTIGEWWYAIGDLEHSVVQKIVEVYTIIGWDVRVQVDQRDGDALVFREPR